jgi:hypothetical protein
MRWGIREKNYLSPIDKKRGNLGGDTIILQVGIPSYWTVAKIIDNVN